MTTGLVYCPSCDRRHHADVTLDPDGFPNVRWLADHNPPRTRTREELYDAIAANVAPALVIAAESGHWELLVEPLDLALGHLDPPEEPEP